MGFVWCRVFAKIFCFAFLLLFISFFVVGGYRYDEVDKIIKPMNAFVQVQVWNKDQKILLNDVAYTTVDNQLNLYHFSDGCYTLKKGTMSERFCLGENEAKYLSFIDVKNVSLVEDGTLYCDALEYRTFGEYCIQDTCFQESIKNAFVHRQIHFVKTTHDLWYCAKDFRDCKKLYTTDLEVVCGQEEGLVLQDGTLLALE